MRHRAQSYHMPHFGPIPIFSFVSHDSNSMLANLLFVYASTETKVIKFLVTTALKLPNLKQLLCDIITFL